MRLVALILLPIVVIAECPKVRTIVDVNCDGQVVISVIGDSLVFGTGDSVPGGYVSRSKKALRGIKLQNFGSPGEKARNLKPKISLAFRKGGKLKQGLIISDYVILDLGRNDRWYFEDPINTFNDLKAARQFILRQVMRSSSFKPILIIATLMLPNRGSQGPWVSELNSHIRSAHSKSFLTDLRFDLVSKRLLSKDQIHPTPEGYSALSRTFVSYVKSKFKNRI
jgi:lysophospholipase L1-like esterase